MKSIRDFNFKNKRVLVRVDFNVPVGNDGMVDKTEDWRLGAALPTIRYLIDQEAKIILLAHLGRPGGKVVESLRLNPVAKRLEELLGQSVVKLDDCVGREVEERIKDIQAGEVFLLENLRFHAGEKSNQSSFAQQLAKLGEFYVNDAFGVVHRAHASITELPQYLPSCAGLLLEKEIKVMSDVLNNSKRPLVVIIGGVKISTKIKVIKNFLEKADDILLGGALANTVISAKGFAIGRSVVEEDMVEEVKNLQITDTKLHIPVDVVTSTNMSGKAAKNIAPIARIKKDEMILDIGPDTSHLFSEIISRAKTIIWNGPMGLFEVDKFALGSRKVAQAVTQNKNFSLVGGGETISLLEQLNLLGEIKHISTGGGAMLEFLAGTELPGLKALGYSSQ